jgi:ribonuclease HI
MSRKTHYAVLRGRRPGIYTEWAGAQGAEAQVKGFPGARYRGFATREEAERWLKLPDPAPAQRPTSREPGEPPPETDGIVIFTDGSCRSNPGPGGYGAIVREDGRQRELSGGFQRTTNNRMELMACIAALRNVEAGGAPVTVYSDSSYVVRGMTRGWPRIWQANGWMKKDGEPVENPDLWQRLLELADKHSARFVWVRGHVGHPENERCDQLAREAAGRPRLPRDPGYPG